MQDGGCRMEEHMLRWELEQYWRERGWTRTPAGTWVWLLLSKARWWHAQHGGHTEVEDGKWVTVP